MDNITNNQNNMIGEGVEKCKIDLSQYFHPENQELSKKFLLLYQLADYTDNSLGSDINVDRTTMNRYRRGVFIPTDEMKIKICKKLTEKIGKYIAIEMIWGSMELNIEEKEDE